MIDDLEAANASIRRGARLAQIVFPGFAILCSLVVAREMVRMDATLLAVPVILIALTTAAVIFTQARRLGRFQLTISGVDAPNGEHLPWNRITRATAFKGSLSLYDGAGHEMRVAIMFAMPQAKVLAAIRARLPHGVQLDSSP